MAPVPTSKFIEVRCTDCGNEQRVFNKPSTTVACLVCGTEIAEPRGGEGEITAEIIGDEA